MDKIVVHKNIEQPQPKFDRRSHPILDITKKSMKKIIGNIKKYVSTICVE